MTRASQFWSDDLDWLIRASSAALGLRGSAIAPGSTNAPSETFHAHLAHRMRVPDVGRCRRLLDRWNRLTIEHQRALEVHYGSRDPARYQDPGREHGGQTSRGLWPRGSELLGDCAAVALWLAYKAVRPKGEAAVAREAKVISEALERQQYAKLERWRNEAEALVGAAHEAWRETAQDWVA